MDLQFTAAELALREEVRAFIRAHLPLAVHAKMLEHRTLTKQEIVSWQRTLRGRGWATPSWPKTWGGPGWTPVQRHVFLDALHSYPAPEPLSFNVSMIGPVIGTFGTEQQKVRLLPRIANLDDWWCQGFSEPGAGSDLASLTTSAVRDGDDYIVNGAKMWQGMAQHADWMFTLVRTDPHAKKQAGITFLLIDLRSPGVSVRPIITIDGRHEVNSVFLDQVRVPVANRVHLENHGWEVAKFLLGNERIGIARLGMTKYLLQRARGIAAQVQENGRPLAEGDYFRRRCAELEVGLQALEITQLRVLADAGKNGEGRPDPRSSILKLKGVELRQAASELLLRVAGPLAMPAQEEFAAVDAANAPAQTPWSGSIAPVYFGLRAASIYGGSNEVQKNILAQAMLGLPRS